MLLRNWLVLSIIIIIAITSSFDVNNVVASAFTLQMGKCTVSVSLDSSLRRFYSVWDISKRDG